ncbi:MAG: thrombospondin type 3 repeat-containing protein, partial [Polyangiaceae bacterium]|nr:thrombospondin type 3 repeat-containing protein [Polyangiaceae bacterium]
AFFSGQVQQEMWNIDYHLIAGFGDGARGGERCRLPSGDPTGRRSFARISAQVRYTSDAKDWPLEFHCHEFRIEYSYNTNPIFLPGDSGAPVFARRKDGTYQIMGVHSGPDCADKAMVAATVQRNYRWLTEKLGGDLDGDGILDALDNCPPWRCVEKGLSAEACANADQEDTDGDGVGEICDNCPASKCAVDRPGFDCANPDQLDWDQDGDGDQCDLCPDNPALTYDDDGDGVGEACDSCDSYQEFPSCSWGGDCASGRCVGGSTPHCSQLPDSDGDGIGDACDLCPHIASYDTRNSNQWAERRESMPAEVDVCEEVPQVRVTQIRHDTTDISTTVLNAEPVIGGGRPPFAGRARMGFCSCFDQVTGTPLPEDECLDEGRLCSAWNAPTTTGVWKPVTLGPGGEISRSNVDLEELRCYPLAKLDEVAARIEQP